MRLGMGPDWYNGLRQWAIEARDHEDDDYGDDGPEDEVTNIECPECGNFLEYVTNGYPPICVRCVMGIE